MRRVSRLLRRITVAKDSEAPLVPVADLERRVKSFAQTCSCCCWGQRSCSFSSSHC